MGRGGRVGASRGEGSSGGGGQASGRGLCGGEGGGGGRGGGRAGGVSFLKIYILGIFGDISSHLS